jgi:hypothetical protein
MSLKGKRRRCKEYGIQEGECDVVAIFNGIFRIYI